MVELGGCVIGGAERKGLRLHVGNRPRGTAHLNDLTGFWQGWRYGHGRFSGWSLGTADTVAFGADNCLQRGLGDPVEAQVSGEYRGDGTFFLRAVRD